LRHFGTTGTLISTSGAGSASQYYSVKIGELVPELDSFSERDFALLLQYGIEINLRLLPFNFCMSYGPTTAAANTVLAASMTYSIDNIYVGAVVKNYGKVPRPISGNVGFRTFHYVKQALGTSSYTA